MKSVTVVALAALLSTGAQAVPHLHAGRHAHLHGLKKRDIVWVTEFEVETKVVTVTVVGGQAAANTASPNTVAAETPAAVTVTSYDYPPAPAPTTTTTTTTQAPAPVPVQTTTTTTESYVAPPAPSPTTTTTSVYQAPPPPPPPTTTTTTTEAPAPAPPAPSPTYGSGSGSGATGTAPGASYSGDMTWYTPGLGACGFTNSASDDIVAISWEVFGSGGNPNLNPLCGRYVTITGVDGTPYKAEVVDRCTGCAANALDLTESLFNKVTNNGDGRVHDVKWTWN